MKGKKERLREKIQRQIRGLCGNVAKIILN